jgi:hypothetical protein
MKLVTLFGNRIYSVKRGCSIKLENVLQNNLKVKYIVLSEMEQFRVEPYSGYDIYGEDYVIYNGDRFLLRWDKSVLECLIDLNEYE